MLWLTRGWRSLLFWTVVSLRLSTAVMILASAFSLTTLRSIRSSHWTLRKVSKVELVVQETATLPCYLTGLSTQMGMPYSLHVVLTKLLKDLHPRTGKDMERYP